MAGLVAPVVAYCLAYATLLGQAAYYGIPDGMLSVSVVDIIRIAVIFGSLSLFLAATLRGALDVIPSQPMLANLVWSLLLVAAFGAIIWWCVESAAVALSIVLPLAAGLVLLWAIGLVLEYRKHGSLRVALSRQRDSDLKWWSVTFWGKVVDAALSLRPAGILLMAYVLFMAAALSFAAGYGLSRRTTEYYVSVPQPERVVLIVDGGTAVVGRLADVGSVRLANEYEVIDLTSLGPVKPVLLGRLVGP